MFAENEHMGSAVSFVLRASGNPSHDGFHNDVGQAEQNGPKRQIGIVWRLLRISFRSSGDACVSTFWRVMRTSANAKSIRRQF